MLLKVGGGRGYKSIFGRQKKAVIKPPLGER
jgi:hypothetical protein